MSTPLPNVKSVTTCQLRLSLKKGSISKSRQKFRASTAYNDNLQQFE